MAAVRGGLRRMATAVVRAQAGSRCMSSSAAAITDDFLRDIPKTDIHVHLDGSVRVPTIIDIAQREGIELPAYTEDELLETTFRDDYDSLVQYLECFQYTTAVMNSPENLSRIAYEFAVDNFAEGVRYFETRYAPQLHAGRHPELSTLQVMQAVDEGLARAAEEFNAGRSVDDPLPPFRYGIIACALRFFMPGMSPYYDALLTCMSSAPSEEVYAAASRALAQDAVYARDSLKLPIVALDLAGAEAGFPAKPHAPAFDIAQENFMRKTVHAGEAYTAESVKQAMVDLQCHRIGHGHNTFVPELNMEGVDADAYIAKLIDYAGSNRVTMEVCLTSNRQTMPFLRDGSLSDHAFAKMLDLGVSATICTDNRLMSRTNTIKELRLAVDSFDMTPEQLKRTVLTGFEQAFFPGSFADHTAYLRQVTDMYEQVERKHGI